MKVRCHLGGPPVANQIAIAPDEKIAINEDCRSHDKKWEAPRARQPRKVRGRLLPGGYLARGSYSLRNPIPIYAPLGLKQAHFQMERRPSWGRFVGKNGGADVLLGDNHGPIKRRAAPTFVLVTILANEHEHRRINGNLAGHCAFRPRCIWCISVSSRITPLIRRKGRVKRPVQIKRHKFTFEFQNLYRGQQGSLFRVTAQKRLLTLRRPYLLTDCPRAWLDRIVTGGEVLANRNIGCRSRSRCNTPNEKNRHSVNHFTPDMCLPHVEFVRRATGKLPEGAWVGTVSKLDGKVAAISSKYFFGYQLPGPDWVQAAVRDKFE